VEGGEAVGQRGGARLQDQRRLHLVQFAVAHGRHVGPAGPRGHLAGLEFLAAPRTDDDVGHAPRRLGAVGKDAIATQRHGRPLREDVVAAGHAHQFGDPADGGDRRFVPFLEIHARAPRQARGRRAYRFDMRLDLRRERLGLCRRADHRAEPADVAEDAVDAAVVADPHLDPGLDQLARNIGLDVGKANRQVRLQLQDLADLRAGERRHLGLFLARLRWTHGEAGNADDAVLLAERVQHLGRLLGHAHDAPRIKLAPGAHGYSNLCCQASARHSQRTRSCRR
jgi:hypothetical protein